MANAGLSRAEIEDTALSEGGPGRGRGRNGSASLDGFASRAEEYLGSSDSLDGGRGMGAVYEEQSAEYYDEHDETAEQWQHSVDYDGEEEPRSSRLPISRREMMSSDGHNIHRDRSPPPNGYESGSRLPRGGGRGYRDDYGEDDVDDGGIIHRNSNQDYLESEVADDVAYRSGRHRGESSASAEGATMERATLPGAYASMEDPNAKSQIKEQIQNELQEFERALRSSGGNGRTPNRRGHGPRLDDSYQSEESSIRQASANRRGVPASRRGVDPRSAHYYSRGGDDDSYYDESSVHSNSSLHRQTSRGNSSTSSDRRTYMERGGSGRNIISRNIPRDRDRHDRGGMSQRRGSGERFYHDSDPRDRGARYERSYGYQDYYERGGGVGAGDDDSLASDRGAGHSSSSLSRRELESRLAPSRGHDRGAGVGGGGYRGGGAPGGRSHIDRSSGIDHRRMYDDGNHGHGSYRGGSDSYHRQDRSPQQSFSQSYSRRQNSAPEHRNNSRGADYHRSYPPADRHPPQHHQQVQQQQQPQQRQVELEISPGVWMSLRGADETWNAIMNGAYCPTTCMMCSLNLLCVLDAEYVLCPECRVVGPIGEDEFGMRAEMLGSDSKPHGVGLGFKPDDLMRWQSEIARGIDPRNSSFFSQSKAY